MTPLPTRQAWPEHEQGAPRHGHAGDDVFTRRLVDEEFRGDDGHRTCFRCLGREDSLHATEVIDVAVGENHRRDRLVAEMLLREG